MSDTTRKEFIGKMKDGLDDLDKEIDKLDAEAKKLEGEAKKEYENRLHDLREKRGEVKKKLDDLHSASEEQWQKIKDETEHVWKALSSSFNYFKSQFK